MSFRAFSGIYKKISFQKKVWNEKIIFKNSSLNCKAFEQLPWTVIRGGSGDP